MRHVTGNRRSGRIGTGWVLVVATAAALIVLGAAARTARACVNCTPGGSCERCSYRSDFLYGVGKNLKSSIVAAAYSPVHPDVLLNTMVPLKFACRTITYPATSETYDQIILTWGERLDINARNSADQTFSRCFQRKRKGGDTLIAAGHPATGMAETKGSTPEDFYLPLDTAGNDATALTGNGVKIGVSSGGDIVMRDREAWGEKGSTLTHHAKIGWELRDAGQMFLWRGLTQLCGNGTYASPISSMTVGTDMHYYKYDMDGRLVRDIVMRDLSLPQRSA